MIDRETRSTPIIWIPQIVTGGHSHSHNHGGQQSRDPYNRGSSKRGFFSNRNMGRDRTLQHDPASNYGHHAGGSSTKVFVVNYKRGGSVLCCASMFTLVQLAIGALNMGVFIYAISVGDLHGILNCLAFHLFSVEGILAMSYKNGWSLLMGYDNRTMCHTILQICTMIFAITGITIKLVDTGISASAHCIAGLCTAAVAIPTLVLGPIGLFKKSDVLKKIHMFFGLATFVCATVCFGIGIFLEKFREWCKTNSDAVTWILLLCLIYIAIVVIILVICKVANIDMLRLQQRQ